MRYFMVLQKGSSWHDCLSAEFKAPYMLALLSELDVKSAQGTTIYPSALNWFHALETTALEQVKVVILGQDPYHQAGQAHGLCFSVQAGVKVPPSLVNIYKELANEFSDFKKPNHGCLTQWAEQGVLLLNTVLTVKKAQAHSHAKLGWETFTDAVINSINEENRGCVFLLWGAHAQKKGKSINTDKHLVLNGPHPSPLSAYRGFFGCQHFSKANEWLLSKNIPQINWHLPTEL